MSDVHTHEVLEREEELEGPSNRSFGLTVGGILCAISVLIAVFGSPPLWLLVVMLAIGGGLVTFGLLAPERLTHPNRLWMRLSLLLSRITNPVIMGLLFVSTIVPIGLAMRLFGKNPLALRFDKAASTYWIDRTPPGPAPESIVRQF